MGLEVSFKTDMNDTTESRKVQAKRKTREPADISQKLAWLKAIHADKDLSRAAKNVAVALFMHHNSDSGVCCVKQATLGEAVALQRKSVNRVVDKLEDANWITAEQTLGASYYILHVARAKQQVPAEVSPIEDTADDQRCPQMATPCVPDPGHHVSPDAGTEPSISTVSSNRLSLRTPAGAEAGKEKSASGGVRQTGSSWKPSSRPVGLLWPEDFYLTEEREMEAERAGLKIATIPETFAAFRDHAHDTGRRSADWDAAWRNWCRKAAERQKAAEAKAGAGRLKPNPRYYVPPSQMR